MTTTKKGPRPATLELLRAKPPHEQTVELSLDPETTVALRFRSIGARAYDRLIKAHQEGKDSGAVFNGETFAPALIAASLVDPVLTEDQVLELVEQWSTSEIVQLFAAALEVNTASSIVAT